MEATNWQRPVTEDGKLDVRAGDVWEWCHPPVHGGWHILAVDVRDGADVAWVERNKMWRTVHFKDMTALASRNDISWDVPEDKRKGQWVCPHGYSVLLKGQVFYPGDSVDGMAWLPDAPAAPEPVRMDAPEPGKCWECDKMVYRPIHDGDGTLRYLMPNGTSRFVHYAHGETHFVGYYYAHDGSIRNDSVRYQSAKPSGHRNPSEPRYSPGDIVHRPSHVVFKKGGE